MMTIEQVKKNVESLYSYEMEDFARDVEYYYKALASKRLIFCKVKKLKNYHVYKIFFVMEDGFAYSMHTLFRSLGYRVNDKFEVYLPCYFLDVPREENEKILNFFLDNHLVTRDEYEEVKDIRVIEI